MLRRASVAVVLLTAAVVGCTGVPGGSASAGSSIGPSTAVTEPTGSAGTPSLTPSPSPLPTETPYASPSPAVTAWSGLHWSDGVLGRYDDIGYSSIAAILPWGDGYVGVGSFNHKVVADSAFFTSADGLRWTITHRAAQADGGEAQGPRFLVRVGDDLLAVSDNDGFSPPNLWRSRDGLTWSALDNPSWRKAWANRNLLAIASAPAGLVAIGSEGLSLMEPGPPVVVSSSDGAMWTRLDLPSTFDHAVFSGLLASGNGFVIVGRDGQPDATPEHGGALGVGKPAAWVSFDGSNWTAAHVEGTAVAGGQLSAVSVGVNGFFAEGRADASRSMSGWTSTDGTTWRLVGKLGTDLPDATLVAGDGTHMVMLGRKSCKTTALLAWVSTDGTTWTRLAFSGSKAIPDAVGGPICEADGVESWNSGGMVVSDATVVPDGVLVVGSGNLPQEFWFATATP